MSKDTGAYDSFYEETTSSPFSNTDLSSDDSRDEVAEVEKTVKKETRRLLFWRSAVTLLLVVTAFVVTLVTYRFLKAEQANNFTTAVSSHC